MARKREIKLPTKLPTSVALPFGFKIKVVLKELPSYIDGQFDFMNKEIQINRAKPIWDQFDTLAHELVHAAIDYHNWVQLNIVRKLQIEAAETLMELAEDE